MKQYLDLLNKVSKEGVEKEPSRPGMPNTLSIFGYQYVYDLEKEGFPLLTTKRMSIQHVLTELLWFLKGHTNIKYLIDRKCNIWNQDAYRYYVKVLNKEIFKNKVVSTHLMQPVFDSEDKSYTHRLYTLEEFVETIKNTNYKELPEADSADYVLGDCGKQYGYQWRGNELTRPDQLVDLIYGLKTNPMSRRHIITAWRPEDLADMALPSCHSFVQFNCRKVDQKEREEESRETGLDLKDIPEYYLDCQLYQRSADVFLGVPYNIASYSLLVHIISFLCNMKPGKFIHSFGDVHMYDNHSNAVEEQLKREPFPSPEIVIGENEFVEEAISKFKEFDTLNSEEAKLDLIYESLEKLLKGLEQENSVYMIDYNHLGPIRAELSTGI